MSNALTIWVPGSVMAVVALKTSSAEAVAPIGSRARAPPRHVNSLAFLGKNAPWYHPLITTSLFCRILKFIPDIAERIYGKFGSIVRRIKFQLEVTDQACSFGMARALGH